MMMLVFVCGMAIGAVAAHFATKTPIVVSVTQYRPADVEKIASDVAPDTQVFACPKCGVTSGRNGPFKTAKAVCGHMRACPKA